MFSIDRHVHAAAAWLENSLRHHTARDSRFWFREPVQHVTEFLCFNLFILGLYALWVNFYRPDAQPYLRKPRSPRERLAGAACIAIVCLQFYIKYTKSFNDLAWMAMPCHLLTTFLGYILMHENSATTRSLINITLGLIWAPIFALALPDFEDHTFMIEPTLYVVQHLLLIYLPYHIASNPKSFGVPVFSLPNCLEMILFWLLIFTNIHQALCYLSGYNINYMQYPPNIPYGLLQANPWYRIHIGMFCTLTTIAMRYLFHRVAYPLTPYPSTLSSKSL